MNRYIFTALVFCLSAAVSAQSLTAGGNVKAETMYAMPRWDSELEDSRGGADVQGLLFFSYEPSEKIRARAEIGYSYQTGYANPLGRRPVSHSRCGLQTGFLHSSAVG